LGSLNFLFWLLVIISILCGLYSASSKFLGVALPSFPFYGYIIAHAIVSLIFQPRKIALPLLFLISLNFLSVTFRNTFFSQFGSTAWMVIIMVVFMISNYTEVIVISAGMVQLFRNRRLLIIPCIFAVYFGLVSPFYFGVIKPGPYESEKGGNVEPYTYDRVYEESVVTEGVAPREAARRYFVEGKQCAAKGNMAGFVKSVELYEMALELIPNFSSAYAEMSFAYGSIGKILQEGAESREKVLWNFGRAKEAIAQAKELNRNNPHVWGTDAILQHYMGNVKKAERALIQATDLSQNVGYTDRVLHAMATMAKNRIDRVRYLLAIKAIDPDNAELHNLLGIRYYQINNKKFAKKMFERAKRLSPDFGKPYLNLALVYPKKEVARLYREASHRDRELRSLSSYYSILFKVTKWLWRFYVGLAIVFVLGIFAIVIKYPNKSKNSQANPEAVKKIGTLFLCCNLLFIITYGAFEIYIHFIKPINGIDYMFPIGFPFF